MIIRTGLSLGSVPVLIMRENMDNFWHVITLLFSDAGAELRYIIGVTLTMSLFSTTISTLIGMPLGILIGSREFRLKKPLMRVTHALMSLPPVAKWP